MTNSVRRVLAGLFRPDEPPTAGAGPTDAPEPPSLAGSQNLWGLESKHHCPIVGTCLPMDELVKFARRFGFDGSFRDEYALHVHVASHAGNRSPVSRAVQKHLDRKYAMHLRRFERAKSDAEVRAMWKEHYAAGEVAGPLWAALTHKAASADTRTAVYGDVHMLSHQLGAGQAVDARQLAHLQAENAELKTGLEREQRERAGAEAAWREQVRTLEAGIVRLRAESAELPALRERVAAFESGSTMLDMGRRLVSLQASNDQLAVAAQRTGELEARLATLVEQTAALRAERDRFARERDRFARERDALERVLLASSASDSGAPSDACETCDAPSLQRCVLCVGGRTALVSQYRSLAGRLGIRLVHHDGGEEEAISRLPDMINGADAVICPTDCVSHTAYYLLKRHCKRTGKPCLLFKGAGVSSFAMALARLSSGRVTLSGETAF